MQNWAANHVPFSIILLDIDRFKRVNDTYGHLVGDEGLKFLAEQMKEVSRQIDICCRFGGEEFVILLTHTEKNGGLSCGWVESSISPCGEIVNTSIEISSYPACTSEMTKLIEQADECLYNAKKSGRNRTIVFEPNHE